MKLYYELRVIDEDHYRSKFLVARIGAYSLEGLEEEMGKSKLSSAVEKYTNDNK